MQLQGLARRWEYLAVAKLLKSPPGPPLNKRGGYSWNFVVPERTVFLITCFPAFSTSWRLRVNQFFYLFPSAFGLLPFIRGGRLARLLFERLFDVGEKAFLFFFPFRLDIFDLFGDPLSLLTELFEFGFHAWR